MKKRIFLIGFLATILVLAFFSPVLAREPQIETFEFLDEPLVVDCGNFNALFVDDISVKITTYFDKDSNPKRFQAHLNFDGTVTHSKTGQSFKDHTVLNVTGDLPFDEASEARRGVSAHITVPGKGVVVLRVGRIVTNENFIPIFVAGQSMDKDYYALVCEGLKDLP